MCTFRGGCSFRVFGSLDMQPQADVSSHVSAVLQGIMHWFSPRLGQDISPLLGL